MGRTTAGYKKRDRDRRDIAYKILHSRDAQGAEHVAQVWREREELLKHKCAGSAQARVVPMDPILNQPGASTSAALPHQAPPDFGYERESCDMSIDMNEDLPQALVHLNK